MIVSLAEYTSLLNILQLKCVLHFRTSTVAGSGNYMRMRPKLHGKALCRFIYI